MNILIGATFTASPLEEPISFWLRELGLAHQVAFAGYHQLFQTLLDPQKEFARDAEGINVALLRLEDLASGLALNRIAANLQDLQKTLIEAAPAFQVPLLVCLCPESDSFLETEERQRFAAQQRNQFQMDLADKPNIILISANQVIADYEVTEVDDPLAQQSGHVPYRPQFYAALGTQIVRILSGLTRRAIKVIAVDCDNTLWTGICGEDGPAGVSIDHGRRAFQEFLLAQKRLGRLLAIVSKNNEADVQETFQVHPEWPLTWNDIAVRRINWQAKSGNLFGLAEALGLGLDSFVFLDDDGRECAEVRQNCPEAEVIQIPERTESLKIFLERLWVFDYWQPVTPEDLNRSQLYAEQSKRKSFEREAADLHSFLSSLRLQVVFAPVTDETLPRVAQLTQRTNQMNTTLERFSPNDLAQQLTRGLQAFTVSVSDRFGDYGLVGAVFAQMESTALAVTGFLLSCRALGRGVEHKMLAHAAELALQHGKEEVRIAFRTGPRNSPALQLLESAAGMPVNSGSSQISWISIPAHNVRLLEFDVSQAITQNPIAAAPAASWTLPAPARVNYDKIAGELGTASSIVARIEENRGTRASSKRKTASLPETELQRNLAAIWGQLLGLDVVGIEEDFFDLGGHSLLAVQLISRIHQDLGVVLPDSVIYGERLTILSLARTIELLELGVDDWARYEAALAEINSLSDEEVAALLAQQESSNGL